MRNLQVSSVCLFLLVMGCGGGGDVDLGPGTYTDGQVPSGAVKSLEGAAATLYERIQAGDWDAIYLESSSLVQERLSRTQFVTPLLMLTERLGSPTSPSLSEVNIVHFGEGFPHVPRVPCPVDGAEDPRRLLLGPHPYQASLVHIDEVGTEQFFFSSIWHREEGEWRLATYFVKPASVSGMNWSEAQAAADRERVDEHSRNAALLYNLAIDLAYPNGWTIPEVFDGLRRRQDRIRVDYLPNGSERDTWPYGGGKTFRVNWVNYTIYDGDLAVAFNYVPRVDLADSLAQAAYAETFFEFVEEKFPEYPALFPAAVLQAADTTGAVAYQRVFSWGESR